MAQGRGGEAKERCGRAGEPQAWTPSAWSSLALQAPAAHGGERQGLLGCKAGWLASQGGRAEAEPQRWGPSAVERRGWAWQPARLPSSSSSPRFGGSPGSAPERPSLPFAMSFPVLIRWWSRPGGREPPQLPPPPPLPASPAGPRDSSSPGTSEPGWAGRAGARAPGGRQWRRRGSPRESWAAPGRRARAPQRRGESAFR